uniref:Intraflagellar transport protein 22 homolog isoform X4 n=1 Tax=Pogona vitticeps TaxID=103695 RepID=A0ABM5EMM3_9SAUR
MLKVKILFVGPSEAGKSVLANFLSESTEGIGTYIPTQGVRILEYENPQIGGNGKGARCRFELWDCGGDQNHGVCLSCFQIRDLLASSGEGCSRGRRGLQPGLAQPREGNRDVAFVLCPAAAAA